MIYTQKARLKRIIKSIIYSKYCPVCENWVKNYLPLESYYEEKLREFNSNYSIHKLETLNTKDYYCPICHSTDRDRLYAHYINKLENFSNFKLLDIAPGITLRNYLQKKVQKYRSADLLRTDVDDQLDICDMHIYPDNTFDFLICSHVLEHVPDDSKALSEMYRVLRKNGKAILMVPLSLENNHFDEDIKLDDEGERWRRFMQYDHIRMYNRAVFIQRIQNAGFKIDYNGIEYFGKNTFKRLGLTSTSILYIANKY